MRHPVESTLRYGNCHANITVDFEVFPGTPNQNKIFLICKYLSTIILHLANIQQWLGECTSYKRDFVINNSWGRHSHSLRTQTVHTYIELPFSRWWVPLERSGKYEPESEGKRHLLMIKIPIKSFKRISIDEFLGNDSNLAGGKRSSSWSP